MKPGKVFFHPIDGSGTLTISWSSAPKGAAIEARKGSGVGFFSDKGDLLCVIFDEVESEEDKQALEFQRCTIEISTKNGKVTYKVLENKKQVHVRKRRMKQKIAR